jgi:hypothetical protein
MSVNLSRCARYIHLRYAAALVVAVMLVVACADFDPASPPEAPDVAVATPTLARDVQPIFTARCATSSCHTQVTHQAQLSLAEGFAYGQLVGVPSVLAPQYVRVVPGDAQASWLYRVIAADPSLHPDVPRMPLGRPPLTNNQIATITNWIEQGAPP